MPTSSESGQHVDSKDSVARPKKKTHCQLILEYLQTGHSLTFLESLELFQCRALAQRISELRAKDHRILSKMEATSNGAKIARYWIDSPKEGEQ
jgi:hypothetical protein